CILHTVSFQIFNRFNSFRLRFLSVSIVITHGLRALLSSLSSFAYSVTFSAYIRVDQRCQLMLFRFCNIQFAAHILSLIWLDTPALLSLSIVVSSRVNMI